MASSLSLQSSNATALLGSSNLNPTRHCQHDAHFVFVRLPCGVKFSTRATLRSFRRLGQCKGRAFRASALVNEDKTPNSTRAAPEKTESTSAKKESRIPDAFSIEVFMNQVGDLVELVDGRDIVELHLKQSDFEIAIKKKDATQPMPASTPAFLMQTPSSGTCPPSPPPVQSVAPSPSTPAPSASASAPAAPSAKPSKSSHPPLKSPMAGTFYRSPAPGAPPFVKLGDKVQKGQAVCIIEAMKLMNEIEADQSGTVVDILVDDAKPVSVDTPLLIIAP